ncbi:protein of unknown function DUF6, transmembrane [Magnetococcus marinus MC-1]|uniref:EamA domain-containing protein n=1 Tax=Magnetococcus marinus (strain ATCC BAA-1437 / JCM 17883 / MC-1) TaxID=156889 RepID=A0LB40_MAGMM|nr:DMT family transporter [Magnetococcus marinus]ABK45183.1 protein of unknown function DUF6, transmembrane [Magnetococcus marinus MC-1]
MLQNNSYQRGVVLMLLSAVILSSMGLLVRGMTQAQDWQVVLWRGIWATTGMGLVLLVQNRGGSWQRIREAGWLALLGGVFQGGGSIGFILSMLHTTVANAMFTMSSMPLFTALLAWLVLREPLHKITLLAIAVAMAGVGLMVWDGMSYGGALGNLLALGAALCAACLVVVLRYGRGRNMLPTLIFGALISVMVGGVMVPGSWMIPWRDWLLCLLLGGGVTVAGHLLFLLASRDLSGAQLTLVGLVEFALGPLWVWWFMGEEPSGWSLLGGAVVSLAVVWHTVWGAAWVKPLPGPA